MTVDDDLETWGGGNWTLTINGTDYSNAFQKAEFQEGLNQPIHWQLDIQGLDSSNSDVSDGNIVELSYAGTKAFKGRIRNSESSSELSISLEGLGMAFDLLRRTFTNNWNGTDTNTIVTAVVGSTMNIGTNEQLNDSAGTVDFRMDEEQKLAGLNRLAGNYDGEWWVDEDGNGNDQFNMASQRGGGSSVKTFRTEGDQKNAEIATKNTSSGEGNYDGVVVKGYGDGNNQVKATAGSTGDEDEVLVHTDKTIVSEEQAQERADKMKSLRVDGGWTEIKVVPGDPNEILEVGDVVTVDSPDSDISSQDFRIVERNYNVDFQGEITAELICNNRPATIFDGDLAETKEQTKSESEYMQGSQNVWSDKEVANCSNNEPLELDFYIPPDVQDVVGKNRTASIKLNYSASGYRQSASSTTGTFTQNTSTNDEDRVDDTGQQDEQALDELNTVTVESGDQDQVGSTEGGGASRISNSQVLDTGQEFVPQFSTFTEMVSNFFPATSETQAIIFNLWMERVGETTTDNYFMWLRVDDEGGGGTKFPHPAGQQTPIMNFSKGAGGSPSGDGSPVTPVVTIRVPVDAASREFSIDAAMDQNAEDSWKLHYTWYGEKPHDHQVTPVHLKSSSNIEAPGSDGSFSDIRDQFVNNTSDTKDLTVASVTDNTANTVETIADDVAAGNTAQEVQVEIDGTPRTSDIYGGSFSGTNQDQQIDITDYLTDSSGDGKPDVGWHTVKIVPDQISYMKSRVVLDHKKDNS